MFRSADVPISTVPSSDVAVNTAGHAAELSTWLEKAKARITELESVETMTVHRYEKLMDEVKQRHAEKVSVWKDTSRKNADGLIDTVKVAKGDSVKMSVEQNLTFARFEKHICAQQTWVNANVEQKMTLADAMAKILE